MLEAFDVKYLPRIVGNGQVLAYFVAEFTKDVAGDKRIGPSVFDGFGLFYHNLEGIHERSGKPKRL